MRRRPIGNSILCVRLPMIFRPLLASRGSVDRLNLRPLGGGIPAGAKTGLRGGAVAFRTFHNGKNQPTRFRFHWRALSHAALGGLHPTTIKSVRKRSHLKNIERAGLATRPIVKRKRASTQQLNGLVNGLGGGADRASGGGTRSRSYCGGFTLFGGSLKTTLNSELWISRCPL